MLTLTPYRPMRLAHALNHLFDDAFVRTTPYTPEAYALPLDVTATNDEYVITAAVAGIDPASLNVEVMGDTVNIRAELPAPTAADDTAYLLQERRYGKFSRTLTLPSELDGTQAEANVEAGVLTLRIPRAEAAKPKQIKVKSKN